MISKRRSQGPVDQSCLHGLYRGILEEMLGSRCHSRMSWYIKEKEPIKPFSDAHVKRTKEKEPKARMAMDCDSRSRESARREGTNSGYENGRAPTVRFIANCK